MLRPIALLLATAALTAGPVATASAQTSSAVKRANPVRTLLDGTGISTATLTTAYTKSHVTATATAASLLLPPGHQYGVELCLQVHVLKSLPTAKCSRRDVDTRTLLGITGFSLQSVAITTPRPASGRTGYAQQVLVVRRKNPTTGKWEGYASSWPASNALADASLSLFATGIGWGPLPGMQGVHLAGTTFAGGANTGYASSMCTPGSQNPATPRADLSTTALGSGVPAYYEVGEPSGDFAGRAPRGIILTFHGGGWYANGPAAAAGIRAEADRWRARGWRTVNASYRGCEHALKDALAIYDRTVAAYGTGLPVCTLGQSAGGNLALLVRAYRAEVDCVISQGAPTDLAALAETAGGMQAQWVHNLAVAAFGQENLFWYSPVSYAAAGLKGARLLVTGAAGDRLVPSTQTTALRDAVMAADPAAAIETLTLDSGTTPFVHAPVSDAALAEYHAAEERLVAPLIAP